VSRTYTHRGLPRGNICDAASVHFGPTITRTKILVNRYFTLVFSLRSVFNFWTVREKLSTSTAINMLTTTTTRWLYFVECPQYSIQLEALG